MFTGIIKKVSLVEKISIKKGSLFLEIKKPKKWKVWEGQSIAINGICSTVKKEGSGFFQIEYMPETIKKTTAGEWKVGSVVNLESSLALQDLVDGHLVQGHVDTCGEIINIKKEKESKVMEIKIPQKFMRFIAEKGSVAVDGISLTVVGIGLNWFSISLVSYTLENTNLGEVEIGDKVNIETDVLAKYLDKLLSGKIHPVK